jgi:hydrogenase-4 component E
MSGGAVWALVALALALVVVRRRSAAIALVTLQSLGIAVGALALAPARSTEFVVASAALLAKALLVGAVLAWSLARTREPRPVDEGAAPLLRFVAAVALALAATALVPAFGLESRGAEQAAVALVVLGVATVVARRATLFQALGLLVAENGIALAATAVKGGLPIVIELGVVFDVIVIVAVATAFHERIFGELGTGDTSLLRGLRD